MKGFRPTVAFHPRCFALLPQVLNPNRNLMPIKLLELKDSGKNSVAPIPKNSNLFALGNDIKAARLERPRVWKVVRSWNMVTRRAKARCRWVWSRFQNKRSVSERTGWIGFDRNCPFVKSNGIDFESVFPAIPHLVNALSIEPVSSNEYVSPEIR